LEVDNTCGSGGGLETLASAAMDGGSSHGVDSVHGSPLSTDLCIDESGWYVPLLCFSSNLTLGRIICMRALVQCIIIS